MRCKLLMGLVVAIAVALPPGSAAADATVIATVPVGDLPGAVAVNSSTNRIYVANIMDSDVSVIDGASSAVVGGPIPVGRLGDFYIGVAVNSTTNRIYVVNTLDGNVSVIDGAANIVADTIPVGDWPVGAAVNATTNRVYVANQLGNNVSVIDGATNAVVVTVPVGDGPTAVAANSTTNRIYVANLGSNDVSVIDGAANAVLATLPVGDGPVAVAANPSTNRIYVANSDDTVSVIEDLPEAPPDEPEPLPGDTEDVPLQGGTCNPISSTYSDGTDVAVIAGAVAPPDMLDSLWQFEGGLWTAYSPDFPDASDLTHVDRLDVVFICVGGSGPGAATVARPVI